MDVYDEYPIQNPFHDPIRVDTWVEEFKLGKINASEFWAELNLLANDGDISREKQRQIFWDAHSWERRKDLVQRCRYFNPTDDVWKEGEDGTSNQMVAERLLNRIMALSSVNERVAVCRRRFYIAIALMVFFIIIAIILLSLLAMYRISLLSYLWLITFGVSSLAMFLCCLFFVLLFLQFLSQAKREQRKARLRERVR